MAQQQMSIEMVEVKSEDIIGERRAMFDSFMGATKWGIGAVIALLVGLYLLFG
ncbi:MAG: aa3-type cytochrome c oxidase subunit IV [Roseococcus sp.]